MIIEVAGGNRAAGEITVQGAKNAVLPMIAAAILCDGIVVLKQCPKIQDVYAMNAILRETGATAKWEGDNLILDASTVNTYEVVGKEVGEVRASILFLGSILGRMGQVGIRMPGGCSIGARPIDYHLKALEILGAVVRQEEEKVICTIGSSQETVVKLPYPSVGATENVILYAVLRKGTTEIQNAAKEPEITELCNFLRHMGADITGDGGEQIRIRGVEALHGTEYQPQADRIVFLTYGAMAPATGGEIYFRTSGCLFPYETHYLQMSGCKIREDEEGILVSGKEGIRAIPYLRTGPYPEFPTDAQSLFLALLSRGYGESILEESVFENRFLVAAQLRKMGADIEVAGQRACVRGVTRLHGGHVRATDLRSGAALMVAGLMADGTTCIEDSHLILRGYELPVEHMQELGLNAGYRFE